MHSCGCATGGSRRPLSTIGCTGWTTRAWPPHRRRTRGRWRTGWGTTGEGTGDGARGTGHGGQLVELLPCASCPVHSGEAALGALDVLEQIVVRGQGQELREVVRQRHLLEQHARL